MGLGVWGSLGSQQGGYHPSLRASILGLRSGYVVWDPALQQQALRRAERVMGLWGEEGVCVQVLGPFPSLSPMTAAPSTWGGVQPDSVTGDDGAMNETSSVSTGVEGDALNQAPAHPGSVVLDLVGTCVSGREGRIHARVYQQPTMGIVHASDDASRVTYPILGSRDALESVHFIYTRLARAYWLGYLSRRLNTHTN